jgi:hypothetical protein
LTEKHISELRRLEELRTQADREAREFHDLEVRRLEDEMERAAAVIRGQQADLAGLRGNRLVREESQATI